jgi:hypothetical protein
MSCPQLCKGMTCLLSMTLVADVVELELELD